MCHITYICFSNSLSSLYPSGNNPCIIKPRFRDFLSGTRPIACDSLLGQETTFQGFLTAPAPSLRQNPTSAFCTRVSHFFDTSLDKLISKFQEVEVLPEKWQRHPIWLVRKIFSGRYFRSYSATARGNKLVPILAIRALQKLATNLQLNHPRASNVIRNNII